MTSEAAPPPPTVLPSLEVNHGGKNPISLVMVNRYRVDVVIGVLA